MIMEELSSLEMQFINHSQHQLTINHKDGKKCLLWDPDPCPSSSAYQVATLVKRKSRKAMMDSGRDPREDFFFPSLGLIVSWL